MLPQALAMAPPKPVRPTPAAKTRALFTEAQQADDPPPSSPQVRRLDHEVIPCWLLTTSPHLSLSGPRPADKTTETQTEAPAQAQTQAHT